MPGPLSWYFHHLPASLHRVEAAANHVTQLLVPVCLLLPQPVASAAAGVIVLTQLWLVASGNFAWLNWLTIALALSAVDATRLDGVLPLPAPPTHGPAPGWFEGLVIALAAVVAVLSYGPVRNMVSRRQVMNRSFNRLHLVNSYGAFGSINRIRQEVVVEGTDDAVVTRRTAWREYGFRGKPGDVRRLPRQYAPYHLRLDWMMWFAAISPGYARPWLLPFVARLLVNDPDTVRLLHTNPFPDAPPVHVRALLYRYRFTDRRERRETGAWWHRTELYEFLAPVSLETLRRTGHRPPPGRLATPGRGVRTPALGPRGRRPDAAGRRPGG